MRCSRCSFSQFSRCLPDPREARLHLAFQFSYVRTEQASEQVSLVCLLRSNFGPYTFIRDKGTKGQQRNIGTKGQQRNKGTTQEPRNKGTKKQRNKGTKEQRDKGTKEQRNKGTWILGNLRTWELGNLGTWELGNIGT